MKYKKILLKLSGEALFNKDSGEIISKEKLDNFVDQVKSIIEMGIHVAIVVGGGNIIRGENTKGLEITRYKADNMGMLATVINSIALEEQLISAGLEAIVLSSIEMNKICGFYTTQEAIKNLENGKIVICSAGTANPYFSTDTGTILRALEIGAEAVFKGTQVDGIYDSDPKINTKAKRYSNISYDEFVEKKLKVIDISAVLLAQKEKLPIIIFNIHEEKSLKDIIINQEKQSIIN